MPLIHVDLLVGRTPRQHADLIRALTDAVVTTLGSNPDSVRVVLHEMSPHHYGVGGETFDVVAARREAAEQEDAP